MPLWLEIVLGIVYTVILYWWAFRHGYRMCYFKYEDLIELFEDEDK